MKCSRCGEPLREEDNFCLSCGAIVDRDEEFEEEVESEDEGLDYMAELNDLLNSYKKENNIEDKEVKGEDLEDGEVITDYEEFENDSPKYSASTKKNKVEVENNSRFFEYNAEADEEVDKEEKRKLALSDIPFKVVFIIGVIILLILVGILAFRIIKNWNNSEVFKKDEDKEITSKYDLKKYPNFVSGKTWVCGKFDESGRMIENKSKYLQYDFYEDGSYAMAHVGDDRSLEEGSFKLSLEEVTDTNYSYLVYINANMTQGYKRQYKFNLSTDSKGNTAIMKDDSTSITCHEMDYINNK